MAYLGWISGAVGVVVGHVSGTLTTFYAGKYSFDLREYLLSIVGAHEQMTPLNSLSQLWLQLSRRDDNLP
jgi:hypothetical protein